MCRLLQELCLISDGTDESLILPCYINIISLQSFDAAAIVAEFLIWHEHIDEFSKKWFYLVVTCKQKVTATTVLLACLMSAASDFHENIELNQRLDKEIQSYLIEFLQELEGPIEDVIKAWNRARTGHSRKHTSRTQNDFIVEAPDSQVQIM
ncbi:hypothetical protein BDQ17DRAFT_1329548 [Cyathus striatus]|nr:hypothetical protein BDQ17DRAFT_1329548 [Cyathus striatus]